MNVRRKEEVGKHKKKSKINALGISVLLILLNILPSPLVFAGDSTPVGSPTTAAPTKTPGQTTSSSAVSSTRTVDTLKDNSALSKPAGSDSATVVGVVPSTKTNKMAAATDKAAAAVTSAHQMLGKATAATALAKANTEKAKATLATAQQTKTTTAQIAIDKKALEAKALTEVAAAKQAALKPETDVVTAQAEVEKTKTAATASLQIKTATAQIAKDKKMLADKALATAEAAKTAALKAETAMAAAQTAVEKAKAALATAQQTQSTTAKTAAAKAVEKAQATLASAQQMKIETARISAEKKALADKASADADAAKQAALKPEMDAAAAQSAYEKAKTALAAAQQIRMSTAKIAQDKKTAADKASVESETAKKAALRVETAVVTAQTAVGKAEAAVAKAQQTQSTAAQTVADKKALADQAAAKEIAALAAARKADEAREPNFSSLAANPALASLLPSLAPVNFRNLNPDAVQALAQFANNDGFVSEGNLGPLAQFLQSSTRLSGVLTPDLLRGVRIVTRMDQLPIEVQRVMRENRLNFQPVALVFPTWAASQNFISVFMPAAFYFMGGAMPMGAYLWGNFYPNHALAATGLVIASSDLSANILHEIRHQADRNVVGNDDKSELLATAPFLSRGFYEQQLVPGLRLRDLAAMNIGARFRGTGVGGGLAGLNPTQRLAAETFGRLFELLPGYVVDRILFNSPTMDVFLQWAAVTDTQLGEIRRIALG